MYKKFFFIFILSIFIIYILNFPRYKTIEYFLEGKKYRLYLADTPRKWEKGLMNKKNLKGIDGMLFIFDKKFIPVFYNKNTYFDLDIYWIDGSSVIAKDFLPSIKNSKRIVYISPPREIDKVVEIVRK